MISTICWSCWWREGGRCYSEGLGPVPRGSSGLREGHEITDGLISQCDGIHYESKRDVLEPFFPPEVELVILSESAKK